MPIKPEDFLTTAESLCKDTPSEVEIRCAISRSYYSMYHKALATIDNDPICYVDKGCHAGLIEYLKTHAKKEESIDSFQLRRMSIMLNAEKKKRVSADYFLNDELTLLHASESVNSAQKFKDLCDSLKQS
ncbi:hypothetical protein C9980_12810 [Vibrio mediterranei]|uniref:hypothetical protein n=1 Tax=Vibrio mediterranei TaxID=689 RepID=UPI000D181F6E|nr:hypothetical protein [Vibrio mediterranei]PTC04332.1 hypothetical protein C9980_12810 [Vibrio mediterranei]